MYRLFEVVKVHVRAKFHPIQRFMNYRVNREKKTAMMLKTILSSLLRAEKKTMIENSKNKLEGLMGVR